MNIRTRKAVSPMRNSQRTKSQSDGCEFLFCSLFLLMRSFMKRKVMVKTVMLSMYPRRITKLLFDPNQSRKTVVISRAR